MTDQAHPSKAAVLVYSDDRTVRQQIRVALGRRVAGLDRNGALRLAALPVVLLVGVGVASGPVAGAGALLLVLAAGAAGYHRLVAPQRALAVVTTAAQHLGQVLLVLVVIGVGG